MTDDELREEAISTADAYDRTTNIIIYSLFAVVIVIALIIGSVALR